MIYQRILLLFHRRRLEKRLKVKYGGSEPITFIMRGRSVGFFSTFFQVIGALYFCKKYGHNLTIDFVEGPYYEKDFGDNWWLYYFCRDRFIFSSNFKGNDRVLNEWEQKEFSYYGRTLPSLTGNAFIEVVRIQKAIHDIVLKFKNGKMNGSQVITGIHYRGTDKVAGDGKEADRVPYEQVGGYLDMEEDDTLFFVATDEQDFLDYMESVYGNRVISHNAIRSSNSASIHSGINGTSRHKAGEDALIECMLLSCCAKLIRTDSNLSYACRFFSPQQKTVLIGKHK